MISGGGEGKECEGACLNSAPLDWPEATSREVGAIHSPLCREDGGWDGGVDGGRGGGMVRDSREDRRVLSNEKRTPDIRQVRSCQRFSDSIHS